MSSGVGRSETGACAAEGVARGAQVKVTLRARPPCHVAAERPSTRPVAHETLAASDNGALQQVTLGTAAALGTGNRRRRLRAAAFRWLRRWPRCRYRLRHRDLGHALPLRWGSRQLLPREQRLELCETAVHLHEVVAEPHERRLVLRSAGHPCRRGAKRSSAVLALTWQGCKVRAAHRKPLTLFRTLCCKPCNTARRVDAVRDGARIRTLLA